jgi:hypothetical protein
MPYRVQTNFTSGELDPRLASRIDVDQYYNGAERLRDVIVNPLGGASRAPGLQHIDILQPLVIAPEDTITATAPNGGTAANALDGDITTLLTTTGAIGVTNPYVVAHYDLGSAVVVESAEIIGASTDISVTGTGKTGLRPANKFSNDQSIGSGTDDWTFGEAESIARYNPASATGTSNSPYARFQNFNLGKLIPADAMIVGIELFVTRRARRSTSGNSDISAKGVDNQVRLIQRGVIVGTNKADGSDLWGTLITREQIVRSDFGFAIAATAYGADVGAPEGDLRISKVRVRVTYTTARIASPDEFAIQYSTDNIAWTTYGAAFAVRDNDEVSFRHRETITARYWRYARVGATNLGAAIARIRDFNIYVDATTFADSGGLSDCVFVDFDFSLDQRYMIVFSDRNAAVYEDGILQINVPAPYTSEQLPLLKFDQRLDTVVLFHPDVPPQIMQRQGASDKWVLKSMVFDYIPKHAFTLTKTNPNQTLTPSAVTGSIILTAGGGSVFVAGDVGQYVNGNGGRARIYKYNSATVVLARVEIAFIDNNSIAAGSWTLERGYEAAWSVTRGWPICGVFYQNRLYIGGSRSLPDTVNGSRLLQFFDFNLGRADADDGIEYTLENRDVSGILSINAGRHLQFFTKTAEFYVPQAENQALTPTNFSVRKSTKVGSKVGSNIANAGPSVIFIQAEGQSIQKFDLGTGIEDSGGSFSIYAAEDMTSLSSHLIRNPVQVAYRQALSTNDPNLLLAVNDDGTLAICSLLDSQGVKAWVLRSTFGLIKRVGVLGGEIYVMVGRTINGTPRRFIERFNNDCLLDGAILIDVASDPDADVDVDGNVTVSSVDDLTDLYEGEEVQIILDGSVQNAQTVSGGEITFDRPAEDTYQIGFGFDPLIRPMPVARAPDGGEILFGKKRVSRVLLFLYETAWAEVNGRAVGLQQFGGAPSPLDNVLQPFTGKKVIDGILGWSDGGQFDVTQGNIPAKLTLTGMEYQIIK